MATIHDFDILNTKSNNDLYLDLECGFGQPSVSTVYLKKNDGTTQKLSSFDNNTTKLNIGSIFDLKFNAIEIHTTIDDIRDSQDEQLDISLIIKVYDSPSNFVDSSFTKKTKGKGAKFNSFYTITIF